MNVNGPSRLQDTPQGESQVGASLSGELHAVYDRVLEKPLPLSFGRLIGELVFRDLYPFSTAFDPKYQPGRAK